MILNYSIPEELKRRFELAAGEELFYCVPYDIDTDGSMLEDSFVAVSTKHLFITKKGQVLEKLSLDEAEEVIAEPQINCGVLIWRTRSLSEGTGSGKNTGNNGGTVPEKLSENEKETGHEYCDRILVRYSSAHLSRYAYIARGCRLLKAGDTTVVQSDENEKTCPVCHRALPGTRECPHCTKQKGGLVRFIWQYARNYKMLLTVTVILMLAATASTLLSPALQRILVDDVIGSGNGTVRGAVLVLSGMLALSIGIILINAGKYYLCAKLGADIATDLRKAIYAKIQELSLSFINDRKPGELMNRVINDTNRVRGFMGEIFCDFATVAIIFVFDVIVMLILNWKLALLAFAFAPVTVAMSLMFRKVIHRRFHMQWVKDDNVRSNLQDVISGMAVVKSYGQEDAEAVRFNEKADAYADTQRSNETVWAVFFPALQFLLSVGTYFIVFFGGRAVIETRMTAGELIQFVSYTGMLYQYVGWLSNLPRHLMNIVTAYERISDVMNQTPGIRDGRNAIEHRIKGNVEFRNASFGYKSYKPVLDGISLSVKQGEMIGLVGASGTGKSTMINLIMHLYEIDNGELLIDGINIKDIALEDYHSQIGVVLQETFLFSGTILNNIRFAKPNATYEEIITAAKMANAHDFICRTPDGYNTYVGEKGYNLSGGERQRIAIARAILNNPRILILDEATASLDTESEYLIQKALERLTAGRTTFAIAHRLSTLRNADRLVVIDGHHIAEIGTHNELMEKKGIYYSLVTAQLEMNKSA
ncbi:MAG: ABC transporter ATP-binding protein/permease [Lachnospiraceae bacterium]|nr:ABC transporter ATP-binding protein/permease [Lachnospiraceae bacterium]